MGDEQPKSKLDLKFEKERRVSEGAAEMWEELWLAIQDTRSKLQSHRNIQLEVKRNDGNSLIQVIAPVRYYPAEQASVRPILEIRFERPEARVIARLAHKTGTGSPAVYRIEADENASALSFHGRTPIELAELLVAERLLGIKLD